MAENKSNENWTPKIVGIVCNWCTYAGADLAGRINPFYVFKALQEGADGVLVSGCHPGECHYLTGNLSARRKFNMVKNFLSYIGVEPNRVTFTWCSASEGERFSKVVKGVTEMVKELGPATKLVKKL